MYTQVKTDAEITAIRESGRILSLILDTLGPLVKPGNDGKAISAAASREMKGYGVKPAFLGYMGYPDVICISRNDEVVHGIPNAEEFQDGDVVGLDFGVVVDGMISDSARSYGVGKVSAETQKLLDGTKESLMAGIKVVKDGVHTGDIGAAIEAVLSKYKFGIIRDLVGHGVGHHVHEEPNIPNYGQPGSGDALKAGMTIAIEPMSTLGGEGVSIDADGWTVRTNDGSLSAHFEHTVLITLGGVEVLSQT